MSSSSIKSLQFLLAILCMVLGIWCSSSSAIEQKRPTLAQQTAPLPFSFAQVTDIHIGDGAGQIVTEYLKQVVSQINQRAKADRIAWVFATGDLTAHAQNKEYLPCASVLQSLEVPWIPMLGNHDMWVYNATYEEPKPTAEFFFLELFQAQLQALKKKGEQPGSGFSLDFVDAPCSFKSPVDGSNITRFYNNFELRIKQRDDGELVFLGLDWNSRRHAVEQLHYKGSWPGADLHDESPTCGTFGWLHNKLAEIKSRKASEQPKSIVILQHHPFRVPFPLPDEIYAFSHSSKAKIRTLLSSFFPPSMYWGIFAGHFHRWFDGKAFDESEWSNFHQHETAAGKDQGHYAIVRVEDGYRITAIERYQTSNMTNVPLK